MGARVVTTVSSEAKADFVRRLGAALMALLALAGVGCCVAMSMPQVHIVAYCADLGYGPARGAEMLSLMLACGIVSRLVSGWICDRIGGLRTLLLGSVLQGVALLMFLWADGVSSLFLVSAMFGLFQGGIVPSYALIVREYFTPKEAGARVGTVLMATLFGMALGGWMSGAIFDLTGSYRAAFLNGTAWNLLNIGMLASPMFSATLRSGTKPWALRSCGRKPIPRRIASRGADRLTGLPSNVTVPLDFCRAPASRLTSSDWPLPTLSKRRNRVRSAMEEIEER